FLFYTVSLLSFVLLLPLCSPLFPYTTLFRSAFLPDVSRSSAATLFLSVLALFVMASTHWVGRLSTVLIGAMVLCFLWAVSGVFPRVSLEVLLNTEAAPFNGKYAWLALPVCLASFGFHGNVPGLVDYNRVRANAVA